MRLKSIKLAGFKSFVDPTTVSFPSNMAAVVGPNGCGKSNIIDAVRWVMGESSAKNLRGESMTDVIFNGSNTRKPVTEVHGEGIFIRFREDAVRAWEGQQIVLDRDRMLLAGHREWRNARGLSPDEGYPGIRYAMLHTFAHLLVRELALECGYNAASIRERIYASADPASPMAGVLLYTAAADSDGTLGGLVELGKPENLGPLIEQALVRAGVCSSECKGTLRFFERGASLQTENLWVKCDGCDAARSLVHAFGKEGQDNLPACRGRHPHLDIYDDSCEEQARAVLLGATNSWFPITLSVLAIPMEGDQLSQLGLRIHPRTAGTGAGTDGRHHRQPQRGKADTSCWTISA